MKKWALLFFLPGFFLHYTCKQDGRKPPGREEVYAIRDSMRNELLLRIGRAQQEISRQVEAMKNQAYDAERATARRLNQKIKTAEKAYVELGQQAQLLSEDSLLGDWKLREQQIELLIIAVSRELDTPL